MSIEGLTKVRNIGQMDDVIRALAIEESDPEIPFRVVKILRATIKDDVLVHFLSHRGLALLYRWLLRWSDAGESASTGAADFDADKTVEVLKLLRQLPVSKSQLLQNADLCQRLRKISKENADSDAATLAKEVIDLWKKEVLADGEEPPCGMEEKNRRYEQEHAEKHSKTDMSVEHKKNRSKSESQSSKIKSRRTDEASESSSSTSASPNSQNPESKGVEFCAVFAAAIGADEASLGRKIDVLPVGDVDKDRGKKKRSLDKTKSSGKRGQQSPHPKKLAVRHAALSAMSKSSGNPPATAPSSAGSAGVLLPIVVSDHSRPVSDRSRPVFDRSRPAHAYSRGIHEGKLAHSPPAEDANVVQDESSARSTVPSRPEVNSTKKKRVSWNPDPDLVQIHYFVPLPPEPEPESEPEPEPDDRKSWDPAENWRLGELWRRPKKLDIGSFPMPFIQPGSRSVEKQHRESRNNPCWSASLTGRFDLVLDATNESPNILFPRAAPKDIPLESIDDVQFENAASRDQAHETNIRPFSSPNQYSLYPSPPYSI